MTEEADEKAEVTVKTVDRVARLLRTLATHGEGAMLSAVARETELGKGTVHRLLAALIEAGLVFQYVDSRRYRLGAGLGLLAHAAHQHEFASLARPFLIRLAEETQDTVFASVREGVAAVCVAREAGSFPVRALSLGVGQFRPLGVGSGSLALLAFLADDEIDQIGSKNAAWLARYPGHDRTALRGMVADTRRNGFSFVDSQVVRGMSAIGVPILNEEGCPVGALSLAAISERVRGRRALELVRALRAQARHLSKSMGLEWQGQQRQASAQQKCKVRVAIPGLAAKRLEREPSNGRRRER